MCPHGPCSRLHGPRGQHLKGRQQHPRCPRPHFHPHSSRHGGTKRGPLISTEPFSPCPGTGLRTAPSACHCGQRTAIFLHLLAGRARVQVVARDGVRPLSPSPPAAPALRRCPCLPPTEHGQVPMHCHAAGTQGISPRGDGVGGHGTAICTRRASRTDRGPCPPSLPGPELAYRSWPHLFHLRLSAGARLLPARGDPGKD